MVIRHIRLELKQVGLKRLELKWFKELVRQHMIKLRLIMVKQLMKQLELKFRLVSGRLI
jgi:hypothetical protein